MCNYPNVTKSQTAMTIDENMQYIKLSVRNTRETYLKTTLKINNITAIFRHTYCD